MIARFRPIPNHLSELGAKAPSEHRRAILQLKKPGWPVVALRRRGLVAMEVAIAIALAVFLIDLLTGLQGAIAVLYIAVPLILASAYSERIVIAAAVGCGALTTFAFFAQHFRANEDSADARFGVSLAALAVTTFIALRQKRAADELERSERKFRAIFDDAAFGAWESDWTQLHQYLAEAMAGVLPEDLEAWLMRHPEVVREAASRAVIRNINQVAIRLIEASSGSELVGSNTTRVHAPTFDGAEVGIGRIFAGLLGGKDIVEAEVSYRTLKGRPADIVLRAAIVGYGEPWSSVLLTAFDETERKEARAKLEQVSADLAHAERISTLGQLTASIAHEVSQPLAAIVAYAGSGKRWLMRDRPDLREVEESLDKIVESGSRAADVIGRIRSLVRKAPATMEPVDLVKLVDETIALVAHNAKATGVLILREQERGARMAWADRVQAQQVLVNLILNAIQAMRNVADRQRRLTVTLLSSADGMVHIEVCDTGTGLVEPSAVFAPFFTTRHDGMGMGLSISRSIVEAHGGSIHARNNPDFGATFSFSLRSAAASELEDGPVRASG